MASPLAADRVRPEALSEPARSAHLPKLVVVADSGSEPGTASTQSALKDRTAIGMAALLLSTVLFPMSDMLSKTLAETYSGLQVTWMRYVVLLLVIAPTVARRPNLLRTKRPLIQLARGLSSAMATALALVGFMFLPVAEATAIGFCAPLIVTGLAALVLKESVSLGRWAAAGVGFGGILIIVQPSPGSFDCATLLPLCSSFFSAFTVITTRLGRNERVETTVVMSALVGFIFMSLTVLPVWKPLDVHTIEIGLVMGALAAAASILQVVAYRCAPSSLLAPFSYAQILWASGLGWLVFGSVPGFAMVAGSAIVIASGCAAALQAGAPKGRNWSALRRELLRLDPSRRTRTA